MNILIFIILAIAPCIGIALFVFLKNQHKPGPPSLIGQSLIYGFLSFGIALAIGLLISRFTAIDPDNIAHQVIRALIFVGLVEEGAKFLFLRGFIYKHESFTQPLDGIVYAVIIGMGFAIAENLLYVFQGQGGSLMVRMITAVPAHAAFAVLMGFFVGEAKIFPTSGVLYSSLGLAFAAFAHGYYDYFLLIDYVPGLWWQSIAALIIIIGLTFYALKYREEEIDHD